jgi:hypothetical protein
VIPVAPVLPSSEKHPFGGRTINPLPPGLIATVIAKEQPEYRTLPALVSSGRISGRVRVTTRWRLSLGERFRILWTGNLYLQVLTFGDPLQPLKPSVDEPSVAECM